MPGIKWLVAMATAFLVACSVSEETTSSIKPTSLLDATVKVLRENGHGSAVHIGGGYFLTAAHVVDGADRVDLVDVSSGKHDAEVLWSNKSYDIALLRSDETPAIATANLACVTPSVGDAITASGNPLNNDFITVWGKIAGGVREIGIWKSVVVTDIVTVPGQSGGPVWDESGSIVGITVGVSVIRQGFSASLVGLGYVVPGSAVCGLLARV